MLRGFGLSFRFVCLLLLLLLLWSWSFFYFFIWSVDELWRGRVEVEWVAWHCSCGFLACGKLSELRFSLCGCIFVLSLCAYAWQKKIRVERRRVWLDWPFMLKDSTALRQDAYLLVERGAECFLFALCSRLWKLSNVNVDLQRCLGSSGLDHRHNHLELTPFDAYTLNHDSAGEWWMTWSKRSETCSLCKGLYEWKVSIVFEADCVW